MSQDAGSFRETVSAAFRAHDFVALHLLTPAIRLDTEPPSVTFLEVESRLVGNPAALEQQTRAARKTLRLVRSEAAGTVRFRINGVIEDGPVWLVTTPGRVLAGELARVTVRESTGTLPLAAVRLEVPDTATVQPLTATDGSFHGLFTPLLQADPQLLRVHIRDADGNEVIVPHQYRLRLPGERVVQRLEGTGTAFFSAVTIAPDGTVWAGGTEPSLLGGVLYRVSPDASVASRVASLIADPDGRVEDLVFDHLERLHIVVFARGSDIFPPLSGVVVRDHDILCGTVNAFDPGQHYPFQVRRPDTGEVVPSPSTRAVAAARGHIWLYGSDGGLAQVADTFRDGQCPPSGGVEVRYGPLFQRAANALPTNSVLALVVGADEALWFGTALGLTRFQNGQFTAVPFDPERSVQGDPQTLEEFFQALAEAIFNARPITAVALGNVSFVEEFGAPLSKADIIFSAVEDRRGQLWVGTLGEGLRRIEVQAGVPRDTLHLTRQDGLGSNVILALAVGADGAIYAATEEGVSCLRDTGNGMTITNFSARDGLVAPVWDVAVAPDGIVWLATAGGLFRLVPPGGQVQGMVRDRIGQPVVAADVLVAGTPFRTLTDATGRFVLTNLPPGAQVLQFDGHLALDGPFDSVSQAVVITPESATLAEPVLLTSQVTVASQLLIRSGNEQFGTVGQPLSEFLVGEVRRADGRGIPGLPVTLTILDGGGAFPSLPEEPLATEVTVLTDANGQFTTALILGTTAGANHVEARVTGLGAVLFTAHGQADLATAQLIEIRGNNQTGQPGQPLPDPLVVRLEDQFHNPFEGIPVTATILRGAAAAEFLTPPDRVTNASGFTGFRLQLTAEAEDDIIVEVRSALAGTEPVQFRIRVTVVVGPTGNGIVVEAEGTLLVLDAGFDRLLRVHPTNGTFTIVSSNADNREPLFGAPAGLALETPEAAVVVQLLPPSVLRVDLTSGIRTLVTSNADGLPPLLNLPLAIVMVAPDTLVVADLGAAGLIQIHTGNGVRTPLPCNTGTSLLAPRSLAVLPPDALLVGDIGRRALLRVNLLRSTCDVVSIAVGIPQALALETLDALVFVDPLSRELARLDLLTGRRVPVSSETVGTGPFFSDILPDAIAVTADGSLVVIDTALAGGAVLRVDAETGDRRIIAFLRAEEP
jgi:sugar lactone lactonase YvrE